MHSRIFGLIEKDFYDNHKAEYDWKLSGYYGEDVPHFADYVNEDTDIDKDFMWLIENFVNGKGIDTSLFDIDDKELTITFHKGFKEAYFRKAWEDLVKNVIGSSDAFEKFCGVNGSDDFAYRCKKLISTEYGFYVADEMGCWETMDEFIRRINYDKTYKCFDTVDYHY